MWLGEKAHEGFSMAAEYARAGWGLAQARAEVMRAGHELLDSTAAEEVLESKQAIRMALAVDADITQHLFTMVSYHRNEAAFGADTSLGDIHTARAELFLGCLELLVQKSKMPPPPPMSAVERDAAAILRFRSVTAELGRQLTTPRGTPVLSHRPSGKFPRSSSLPAGRPGPSRSVSLEALIAELFRLHDLNNNGVLEEEELVKLNQKIALLHHGKDANKAAVRAKFGHVFREELDPEGKPVPYATFRGYMMRLLEEVDPDPRAQEMVLEQFLAEAQSARAAFRIPSLSSASDAPFLSGIFSSDLQGADLRMFKEVMAQQLKVPTGVSTSARVESQPSERSMLTREGPAFSSSILDDVPAESSHGYPAIKAHAGTTSGPTLASTLPPKQPFAEAEKGDDDFLEAPARAGTAERRQEEAQAPLRKGDKLQVWSNAKNGWVDCKVIQAFPETCVAEGYTVPGGTVKVSCGKGVKWVLPDQASKVLRRPPAGSAGEEAAERGAPPPLPVSRR